MTKFAHGFLRDQSGATSIEYAAIAGFLSIVIATVVVGIGPILKAKFLAAQTY